jgi:hypothetical protein
MNREDFFFHLETAGLICGVILVLGLLGMLIGSALP